MNIYKLELAEHEIERRLDVDTCSSYDHHLQNVRKLVINGKYDFNEYLKLYKEFCLQVKEGIK